jgi:hypothetical protein
MKTSLTIDGHGFSSYCGGELRTFTEEKRAFYLEKYGRTFGSECSTLRKYHHLKEVAINGKEWVAILAVDRLTDGTVRNRSFHLLSKCGKYKAIRYGENFYSFECLIWRKGLKSTFGKYARGVQRLHNSLLGACKAVATL